jgi:hypothetical protein
MHPFLMYTWDPRLMQQRFWGFFHKKILRLTLILSYIELLIFILILCVPHQKSEWYSNNQNYEVKQDEQGRVENSSSKPQKAK